MYQTVYDRLCRLAVCYTELLAIAKEKQPVLQANKDREALQRLTDREEALVSEAARTERERNDAVKKIAATLRVAPETLDLAHLSETAPAGLGEAMREKGAELRQVLKALQTQNNMNRQLLEINLSFAAFFMDAVSSQGEAESSIYGMGGDEMDTIPRIAKILDSQV